MSKRFKKFLKSAKKAAPVALPLLLGALSKKDVKLPPNPKMDAAVKGAQDALAENQRQIDLFNTPDAVRKMARDPRMINTNMRRIAELRRRGPIMRTVPMETMQEGGMVEAAQDIADKGRNGDSMLVHMAPEEVQGIAALGGVSINPETGLPEMFKFKDFLKVAVPIAITAMAGPAGAAAKTAAGAKTGFLASTGRFLGSGIGKSLLTGAAQFASQRLMGTDSDTALDAGIMAGATYGAGMAANKLMQPSQQQIARTNAIRQGNIATQQAYLDALAPENFAKTTKMVVPQTDPNAGNYTKLIDPSQDLTISSIQKQFPDQASGLRPGMTAAELDAQRGIAQADLDALRAPTDKFNIPGLGEIDKSDVYSGIGAGTIGALSAVPEEEEEERKRKQIDMAKPYSDPVTYPGAGYGSREYGYFGPNYGMYAKEGGHIKRMQEGGDVGEVSEVDEGIRAFQGDLMAFAPGIVGGANYGMGAMPGGMDSVEYNYGVAPNMGGYNYRSFVPEDARGQGITSVGAGIGSGEQVTGSPNVIADTKKASGSRSTSTFKPYTKWTSFSELGERAYTPAQSDRVFRDIVSGYTASGEPIYTRQTRYEVAGYNPYSNQSQFRYGTRPIKFQEGGAVDTTTGADIPVSAFSGDLMSFAPAIAGGANYGISAIPTAMDSSEYNYGVAPNIGGYDYRSFVPADMQGQGIASVGTGMGSGEQVTGDPNIVQRGMAEDVAKKARKEAAKKPAEPRIIRYKRVPLHGHAGVAPSYKLVPVYGYEEGGITSLPQTEGQVEGNGDGMSDEVYGDIENQQEVALSKDEFIVPADVVSSLGNGSSDAGADELYRMMERVRMAKTGKKTQPPEIDAEDYLPA